MPLLTRKRVILAKIETTYGVDSSPTGSANAILVRNLNVQPQASQMVGRDIIRPFLGNFEQLEASTHVEVDFEVEAAASGTLGTVPAFGVLLRSCGLSETITAGTSVVYRPISAGFESSTIYFNVDGVQHKLTGVRGDVEMTINARQIPVFKFKLQGLYNAPTDTALPTVSYSAFQVPLVANNTNTTGFSLFGASPVLEALTMQLGNTIEYRTLIGSNYVQISDRKASGNATFEAASIATKYRFSAAIGSGTGSLSITHGTVAGNKIVLAAGQVDLVQPTYQDNNGIQMIQMGLSFTPSTAGNDELSITFQ